MAEHADNEEKIWNNLYDIFKNETDIELIQKFIKNYHPKSIGDFLQELTGILKNGGYSSKINYKNNSSNIVKFDNNGNAHRVYLANDRPSAVRYMFLKYYFFRFTFFY